MKGDSSNLLKVFMDTYTCGEFTLLPEQQEENSELIIAHRYEDGKIVFRTQTYNNRLIVDKW